MILGGSQRAPRQSHDSRPDAGSTLRVCVLTTSYPRSAGDVAGRFVAESVAGLRKADVHVEVVSPADFAHFGIAYGNGIPQNLRARPWRALFVPAFLVGFTMAARRATRGADVVHAHWIVSGLPAIASRKPFVLQLWGTDVAIARRVPWLVRPIMRRARVVVGASAYLVAEAEALGARSTVVVPGGVDVPMVVQEPANPPHVLFVGRLSAEKGILEFLEATAGVPRVIVGDGPLRAQVPEALGFVPHDELGGYYRRAAVVCVPSRREGYGFVAREALAFGRPVVATRVGGLIDTVFDGINGVLVDVGDVASLRSAVTSLLGDPQRRAALGSAARRLMYEHGDTTVTARRLVQVYRSAIEPDRAGSTP